MKNEKKKEEPLTYATEYHGEKVIEDNDLEPCEKETCLRFSGASEDITINTHQVPLIKTLLRCKFFTVTEIELKGKRRNIVGLSGVFPVSCLRIMKPRKDARLCMIVGRAIQTKKSTVTLEKGGYECPTDTNTTKCVQSKKTVPTPVPPDPEIKQHQKTIDEDPVWRKRVYAGQKD